MCTIFRNLFKLHTIANDVISSDKTSLSGSVSMAFKRSGNMKFQISKTYESPLTLAQSKRKGRLSAAAVLTRVQEIIELRIKVLSN